ncbi:MAG TPA: M48 family metalloprotease [Ilumatobacteraceae bacterium]|nr:M48 family metalloprotease [Ilumatobacteraceae bacterium]
MHTSNTLKTVVLLSGLAGFMVLIGTLLAGTTGLVIGLLVGLGIVGASYWSSDKLAVKAARAREVAPGELDWLQADLAEIARRADMATPRLFIAPDAQPNAFATGRNERTAVVCVTAGLLQVLDRSEIRGVVAHEVAHIRNRDILIGSVAAAVATAISAIANMAMFANLFGGNSDDDAPNPAVAMLLAVVAPMAAGLMQMALSRSREFEADRIGAELLGDPRPLASALAKLDRTSRQVPMDVDPAHATAYIVNPLTGRKQADLAKLFMTHPPMEERIARLLGTRRRVAA